MCCTRRSHVTKLESPNLVKSKLLYITDAYCCWCYGFRKTMAEVSEVFGEQVDIQVVHGGMIPSDLALRTLFSSFPDPVELHMRISRLSGQPFGKAYLDRLRALSRSNRVVNSLVPARALHALKSVTSASELQIFSELQKAYYRDDLDLMDVATHRHVASIVKADEEAFDRAFMAKSSEWGVKSDLAFISRLGVGSFPTLLIQNGSGYIAVARGFTNFSRVRSVLNRVLAEQFSAASGADTNSCRSDGSGCS